MADRFAISFHETFSLSRPSLAQIIGNAGRSGALNRQFLVDTSLGTNYQKAMPRYAFRAGLLDKRNNLSVFGRFAARLDPALEKPATQWLLHYHLAAPHGPTAFWHYLVRKRFLPGNTFTDDDLIADLTEFLRDVAGKAPAPRSIRSTVTIFTGTYLKIDGLRQLGLLEEAGPNIYRVPAAGPPPLWALGYALAEYWHRRIREEWGFAGEDGPDLNGLFRQKYRGGRYSFGYPACPDLADNEKAWEILDGARLGIEVSEDTGFQFQPEQTTCALICHHPRAKYFVAR